MKENNGIALIKIIIMIILFIIVILIGSFVINNIIKNNDPDSANNNYSKENFEEEHKTNSINQTNAQLIENDEAQQKEENKKIINSIEVSVLSREIVSYEDAQINGYGAFSNDYDKATIITVGIKFPNSNAYTNNFSKLKICGETATDQKGNDALQVTTYTSWLNKNKNYALMIFRVAGEVDTSKASVKLISKVDNYITIKQFSNNGIPIGFDEAKKYMGNEIVKLDGRNYIINYLYISSKGGDNNRRRYNVKSYVLTPLEYGLQKSLTIDKVKLVVANKVEDVSGTVELNSKNVLYPSAIKSQTTINVIAECYINENITETTAEEKITKFFKNAVINVDDGDGGIIELPL